MFKRPHHQRIQELLRAFNSHLLQETECFFAGGTAIVLLLDEYRESVDVDFLCSSKEGYKKLRNSITDDTLGDLLLQPVKHLRDVRADRDGIRTFLEIDGVPIKVEIVFEACIELSGMPSLQLPVPVLSIEDLYAEKLLANTDRGLDRSTFSRDLIDLVMLIKHQGPIPEIAWEKVESAYGNIVFSTLQKTTEMLRDATYVQKCLEKLDMDKSQGHQILTVLQSEIRR
jgi:hypothetical protein